MIATAARLDRVEAVVIGTSAGGVEALSLLLPALPANLGAPVLIVQHLPREQPSLLIDIFTPKCARPVVEGDDKLPVHGGTVYFAPPDYHMLIDAGPQIALSTDEAVHYSRPSIDVLFESAADIYGKGLLGIILTGGSEDGAAGLEAVQRAGGMTVVQEPGDAQVSLMVEAALKRVRADHVLPLAAIAGLLSRLNGAAAESAGGGRGVSEPLLPVKCLLVDDRPENLLALSTLLRGESVELLEARSGAEALDLLLRHDVALALLDVQMPDMDGFELAELMRGSERTRRIPIIFVTAGVHDQVRIFQGYDRGAVDFLHKPIDAHILRNKAEVFFQLYRQQQQLAIQLHDRTQTLRLNEMFTAVLGHDLRNPLNALVTGAQLLHHRSEDPAVRRTANTMLSSARRMGRMIDDMLDLARARLAGGIPLKREPADFGILVERVVQEHQATFADRVFEMFVNGRLDGEWDVDRLAQVASNLIGNAVRHGDPARPIVIRVESDSEHGVALTVTNGGVIPPDVLPHIFDPFRGGERSLGRSDGLGLGLYIVQQVVQAHRGSITTQSGGDSTAFRVELPRRSHEVVRL